jgi:hypothetical protein
MSFALRQRRATFFVLIDRVLTQRIYPFEA